MDSDIYHDIAFFKKQIVIVGTSPNVDIDFVNSFEGTKIGIGDAPYRFRKKIEFDYWICANNEFPIPPIKKHLKVLEHINCKIYMATAAFASFSKDQTYRSLQILNKKNLINNKIFFYDERHLDGNLCETTSGCCEASRFLSINTSILEHVSATFNTNSLTGMAKNSVADVAFLISLLSKPEKIVLTGIDFPELVSNYIHYGGIIFEIFKLPALPLQHRIIEVVIRLKKYFPVSFFSGSSVFGGEIKGEILETWNTLVKTALENNVAVYNRNEYSNLKKIKSIVNI